VRESTDQSPASDRSATSPAPRIRQQSNSINQIRPRSSPDTHAAIQDDITSRQAYRSIICWSINSLTTHHIPCHIYAISLILFETRFRLIGLVARQLEVTSPSTFSSPNNRIAGVYGWLLRLLDGPMKLAGSTIFNSYLEKPRPRQQSALRRFLFEVQNVRDWYLEPPPKFMCKPDFLNFALSLVDPSILRGLHWGCNLHETIRVHA
jgi:hypothetical protein